LQNGKGRKNKNLFLKLDLNFKTNQNNGQVVKYPIRENVIPKKGLLLRNAFSTAYRLD
jgi:hypothetical protein